MPKKNKKIPLRKCIVSHEMHDKQQLIRIVKTKEGEVFVDPSGKKNGRGAYVSRDIDVIEKAEKEQLLERHLQVKSLDNVYQDLKKVIKGEAID